MPSVEIDLSKFKLPDLDSETLKARLRQAGVATGEAVRGMIVSRAHDLGARGSYIAGWQSEGAIRLRPMQEGNGVLELEVVVRNDDPMAGVVEDGHEAYSLPQRIRWGQAPRVKISVKGQRYLHIPLRHFGDDDEPRASGLTATTVKRMMPADVTRAARALNYTTKRNVGPIYEADAKGNFKFKQADEYSHPATKKRLGDEFGPRHKGLMKTGTTGHTRYLTIRTLKEGSSGWIIPARPGLHIVQQVADTAGDALGELVMATLMEGF